MQYKYRKFVNYHCPECGEIAENVETLSNNELPDTKEQICWQCEENLEERGYKVLKDGITIVKCCELCNNKAVKKSEVYFNKILCNKHYREYSNNVKCMKCGKKTRKEYQIYFRSPLCLRHFKEAINGVRELNKERYKKDGTVWILDSDLDKLVRIYKN